MLGATTPAQEAHSDMKSLIGRSFDPRSILTSIGEVVYDWDIASDRIDWSLNAAEVFRLETLELLSTGEGFSLFVEPGSGVGRRETVLHSRNSDEGSGVAYRTRYNLNLPNGRVVAIEDTGRWFAGAEGRAATAHGVLRLEECDSATLGARERSSFIEGIATDVAETRHLKRNITIVVASIDNLDRINDELGYEGGDAVIAEVSRRMLKVLRRKDKLARYASNRFAVAMMSCSADQVRHATHRLNMAVSGSPVETEKGPYSVELRIGAACAPDHADNAATLMRRAEDALALAKRGQDAPFVIFDPEEARRSSRSGTRCLTAPDIIDALNERRITFARQPVVEAGSRSVAFHEALARVSRPGLPLLAAGEIVPVFERAGMIPILDMRILELTTEWLALNPRDRLSINLSPMTMERSDWLPSLAGHLGARPGVASRLIIEVTETIAVSDPIEARARLEAMKDLGVAIAIDDFGAGHTSFKHLRLFPVDILKIDGAFVQNLARSTDDRFFVRTLIDLAQHLGITTVAEWVEDEETARMLADWGVDYLQGDHCGKPEIGEDGAAVTVDGDASMAANAQSAAA